MKNFVACFLFLVFLTVGIVTAPEGPYGDYGWLNRIALADEGADEGEVAREPKLIIGRSSSMPTFKAGEEGTLLVPVENLRDGAARNVNVTLMVDDHDKFPFQIENMSLQRRMVSIGAGATEMARFAGLKVNPGAESKIYPISIRVDYTSADGAEGSASGDIFVRIINDKQVDLRVVDLFLGGETLESGVSTEIGLQIKNEGDYAAKDIVAKLAGFTSTGLRLDQPLDTLRLGELGGKEFKTLPFKVYADPDIESGTYALEVTMKYKNEAGQELSTESTVYLTVDGDDGQGKSVKSSPRLIIDNYDFGNDYVRPGEIFELYLSFLNTSPNKDIHNLKISLTSDDNVFSPVGSGSSLVIEKIPAGTNHAHSFRLKSKLDADSKTYNIVTDLEYEDAKGNKYTDKEVIGVAVMQEGRLMIPVLEKPEEAFVGAPCTLCATYFNTGRALIRNLIIRTEGDFEIKGGDEFVGNLEPGKNDYFEVTLMPRQEGTNTGSLVFFYNDEMGQDYEIRKDFSIEAMPEPEIPVMDGPEMTHGPNRAGGKTLPLLGFLFLVLGFATFVIVRKRRRARLEEVNFDD